MDNIREISNSLLGDSYYEIQHKSGLKIFVYPKEGYSTTYAVFGTNYGSIDTFIKRQGETATAIPEGTAHFLEHKLFESEELDAFERFAKTGANANAYTSFDKTCYLFSCSSNFKENLSILLDFVQHPYFTQKTVEKEQGIIGQEIRMYQDEPSWQVLFNLLKLLYHKHPVKIDIAGTVESIAEITADMLYDCYNNFYNLGNMVLAVVGNTTVEEVLKAADENLEVKELVRVERADYGEPDEIVSDYYEEALAVSQPLFTLGFKESTADGELTLKDKILTSLILEYISGDTSPLYEKLFNDGLINTGFGSEYFTGYGYRAVIFSGESRDPKAVADAIKAEIRKVHAEGIREEDFERIRRMHYGRAVMDYNDVDGLANELIAATFEGYGLFDEIEIYKTITVSDAEERLSKELNEEYSAMSVIVPKGEA